MNILVTGGLGVNGCWATRQLLEMGHQPIVLDNRPDFSLVSDIADNVPVVIGDIQDLATITRTVKDHHVQRICHLAAVYPDAADANPLLRFQVNAMATVQLLEAARIMESSGWCLPAPWLPSLRSLKTTFFLSANLLTRITTPTRAQEVFMAPPRLPAS